MAVHAAHPGLEAQARLTLQYDLTSCYEEVENKSAALELLTRVYSYDIDYRDVAERIKRLKARRF
jgi:hypothetical protein